VQSASGNVGADLLALTKRCYLSTLGSNRPASEVVWHPQKSAIGALISLLK
jgi:hypothetical protein